MDEHEDHPVHGRLTLKAGTGETGYRDICKKVLKGGKVEYYAKTRLNLNGKAQTHINGSNSDTAREAAIKLAIHLKYNPPVPKRVPMVPKVAGDKARASRRTRRHLILTHAFALAAVVLCACAEKSWRR